MSRSRWSTLATALVAGGFLLTACASSPNRPEGTRQSGTPVAGSHQPYSSPHAVPHAAPRPAPTCPPPARKVIRSAPGKGMTVALTFDDGPGPAMLAIANVLRTKGVTATFFDTGAHDDADPATVAKVASMGFLIGNHTWDHDYPARTTSGWTVAYLRDQLARTSALQRRLTGRPTCFFRPPGGYLTNVRKTAAREGMSTVLWSVDARDWAQPGYADPAAVTRIVARATSPAADDRRHPIVLMHAAKASHEDESKVSSYRGNTVAALPRIIDWYAAHGYRFVDLLGRTASQVTAGEAGTRP
ncbi:polysaccharide deacetylase family protein [Actinopolymorpha singaporensis]|uniref:Peptidoglycan/xylan/chitin deacetylase, PgdA/CDA1 family n=1 Tax=Actinopolymorpha singaporensis TaxID=117157 RepID=A0A1H1MJG0_9ACTN|nr:polysaccharide deacetylase family protein [Actinopolymorpha singaporensis]SDR86913.1 Peptidoglycan/xylan/chitin deacetylase, PgdA/CDA1 family [Actinopolymorpha singaporensis]